MKQEIKKLPINTVDEAGAVAVKINLKIMKQEISQQKIQEIKKLPMNTADQAGVVAVKLCEIACEKHTANEEAFFIAGFIECFKFLKN